MSQFNRAGIFVFALLYACSCMRGNLSTVRLTIVDDEGQPIKQANVWMLFKYPDKDLSYNGFTNTKGQVRDTNFEVFGIHYSVKKQGYYSNNGHLPSGSQDAVIILRKKKNPIPMYAKNYPKLDGPLEQNAWIGYDFFAADWLPPYGEGTTNDVEYRVNFTRKDMWEFQSEREIRFPNPHDGFAPFRRVSVVSDFVSDYYAPETGYQNEWFFHNSRNGVGTPIETNLDDFQYYYFRIRTQLDENGEVTSAYYGKIYGEVGSFSSNTGTYLNPNENDRNVEFDPRQNLFTGLTQKERATAP